MIKRLMSNIKKSINQHKCFEKLKKPTSYKCKGVFHYFEISEGGDAQYLDRKCVGCPHLDKTNFIKGA